MIQMTYFQVTVDLLKTMNYINYFIPAKMCGQIFTLPLQM